MLRLAPIQLPGRLIRAQHALSKTSRQNISSDAVAEYHGPLANTFRNVKIFSLSSFGLASAITPLFFMLESGLPTSAKVALAATALGTSGISTGLVGWCGAPYVRRLRRLPDGGGIEMETTTLFLKRRCTLVYEPRLFLRASGRPFARWELAEKVAREGEEGEETVAETRDGAGRVLGRWVVRWGDGAGECREVGRMVRWVETSSSLWTPLTHTLQTFPCARGMG
jgi:TMEM70/TMEM186/TMEM223 protein family